MTIKELDDYFNSVELPKELQLHKSTRIINVKDCVESHLAVLKQNEGRPVFSAFYDRLIAIKAAIDGKPAPVEGAG